MDSEIGLPETGEIHTEYLPKKYPVTQTEKFESFFGDSVVVDKNGDPKTVFHGTTISFDKFGNAEQMGDTAGYMGAAYYFTDSVGDVNYNYARVGSDRGRRIKLESNSLRRKMISKPSNYIDALSGVLDISKKESEKRISDAVKKTKGIKWVDEDCLWKIAKVLVESELKQNKGVVYPVYLRIENPVHISRDKGTVFDDSQINEFRTLIPEILDKYGVTPEGLKLGFNKIVKNKRSIKVWDLIYGLNGSKAWTGIKNSKNGREITGQLIADVFKKMGYDGIIIDAYHAFGPSKDILYRTIQSLVKRKEMGLIKGTTHYAVWEPNQITSVFGDAQKA